MNFNSIICWGILLLFIAGCGKPDKLTFTSHENGQSIAEIVTLSSEPFEESVINSGELMINGELSGIKKDTIPWEFDFSTIKYEDNSELFFNILCINPDGDSAYSDTLNLIVDNSGSYPNKVNIEDIKLKNKAFNVSWERSPDTDFSKYILERATISTFRNAKQIFETNNIDELFYRDKSSNPLIFQYYRITVVDHVGYETKGDILSSNLERVPSTVNVSSVTYDTTGMTIKWDRSSDKDFKSYTIYRADGKQGKKSKVRKIESKSTTSHKINNFDPFKENWFWVEVTDRNGYKTLGNSSSSKIVTKPIVSEITSIEYDDHKMVIEWNPNTDSDFKSYTLLHGHSKDQLVNVVATIHTPENTTHTLIDFNPTVKNWFGIQTNDFWGQTVSGSAKTHKIDHPPEAVEINTLKFNKTAIELNWSKSDEDNFSRYTVQHAYSLGDTPDTIAVYTNRGINSHKIVKGFDPNRDNWFWVTVIDSRDQTTASTPQTIVNNPPNSSSLNLSENTINNMKLSWEKNTETDFKKYTLVHSLDPDFKNKEILLKTEDAENVTFDFPVFDHSEIHYFMVKVSDIFDVEVSSEIISGIPTDMKALLDIVLENDLNVIPADLGTQTWENGRLTELSIGNWSDGGGLTIKSVPESIGSLDKLKSLWLSYNKLDAIPETFKNMRALDILELRYNQFTKVPQTIKEMTGLKYLGMSYNNIEKLPDWIGEMPSVNKLFFSHNNLAAVPESICELDLDFIEIQGFFLSHNRLCVPFLLPDCVEPYISDQNCEDN